MVNDSPWLAWFDGAADPNPGEASIGGLLVGPDGERVEISARVGHGTNNFAEYCALIAVLKTAVERRVTNIVVHGDSQLVVNQVNGEWGVNSAALRPLC
jgi:ribonuclease HI